MDIGSSFKLTFTPPTTRADGSPIRGSLTYRATIQKLPSGTPIALPDTDTTDALIAVDPIALKLDSGDYRIVAYTTETISGSPNDSIASAPVDFFLGLPAKPNPPTNLVISAV